MEIRDLLPSLEIMKSPWNWAMVFFAGLVFFFLVYIFFGRSISSDN